MSNPVTIIVREAVVAWMFSLVWYSMGRAARLLNQSCTAATACTPTAASSTMRAIHRITGFACRNSAYLLMSSKLT